MYFNTSLNDLNASLSVKVIEFSIKNRANLFPISCILAQTLTSGVTKAVTGTGATERWYKYTATADGTLTVATASTTGSPNVTVYRGPCASLVSLDTWSGNDTGIVVVSNGDVIIVKLAGTDFTASLTATFTPVPAGALTNTDGQYLTNTDTQILTAV
jgi:hypothetical protein